MRDLLFRNLTSADRRRKVLACAEIIDNAGVRTIIRRHFIYMAQEIQKPPSQVDKPYLKVVKLRNSKSRIERFFCKMKGSIVATYDNRLFLIKFMHTLNINLSALPGGIMKYTADGEI